ncbi:MAG: polyprenyl synthetase family protein [Acidobacteriota bacterium]|nr:polyprenyl synthetase family protein [Acidobacteriota bacterium]
MASLDSYLAQRRAQIDRALDENLPPPDTPPSIIHQAMRYAVLGGGKRIRPILAIAAAEACGVAIEPLLVPCSALELIHTYSLVHDDLPALDNDDLRRGRKTTHVVYGEAIGILTGDALLTEAFSWLARAGDIEAIRVVSTAIDSKGMIGGQVADLEGGSNLEQLEFIHKNKTAKLITASATLGGVLAKASEKQLAALQRYGEAAGLAFQIVDDLLDQEQTSAELGKTAGKDAAQGKLTYPALMGPAEARKRVEGLLKTAVENADMIGSPVNFLAPIARYICERRS